ncbi:MAG: hypothetical protein CM15mV41_0720 [Caudoviricetes sp.]|nr:MAG: hypothetical protein CM15mV41_0720 [Caudoviricetes sp.]
MSETLDKELDNMEQVDEASILSPKTQNLVILSTPRKVAQLKLSTLTPIRKKVLKVRRTLALLLLNQ